MAAFDQRSHVPIVLFRQNPSENARAPEPSGHSSAAGEGDDRVDHPVKRPGGGGGELTNGRPALTGISGGVKMATTPAQRGSGGRVARKAPLSSRSERKPPRYLVLGVECKLRPNLSRLLRCTIAVTVRGLRDRNLGCFGYSHPWRRSSLPPSGVSHKLRGTRSGFSTGSLDTRYLFVAVVEGLNRPLSVPLQPPHVLAAF